MRRNYHLRICENPRCRKPHYGTFASGRFCSSRCAHQYVYAVFGSARDEKLRATMQRKLKEGTFTHPTPKGSHVSPEHRANIKRVAADPEVQRRKRTAIKRALASRTPEQWLAWRRAISAGMAKNKAKRNAAQTTIRPVGSMPQSEVSKAAAVHVCG